MNITRTVVSCFAALLMAVSSFAQTGPAAQSLIAERYVFPIGLPQPVPKSVPQSVLKPQGAVFTVTKLDTNWLNVSDGQTHSSNVTVRNISSTPQTIYFFRYQHIPDGWLSSVCWGTHCYPSTDSSESFTIAPDSAATLILDLTASLYDQPDSGAVWLRVGVVGSTTDTVLLPFYGTFFPSNPPVIFSWSGTTTFARTYEGAGTWVLNNVLESQAGREVKYSLNIEDSLPQGWSLQFCDRRQPYSSDNNPMDTCVFGNALVTNFSAKFDTTYQQRLKFTLSVPTLTQQDSAVIYLSIHPQTNNPADSANYRFVMTVMPTSGVAAPPDERAGIAVTNAWPNPLVSQSTLHLEILTDANGPAKAIVYDVAGTQKAVIDLGTLEAGTNELQLAAPMLPSGEYLFRIVQDGTASEVVKINLLK